MASYKVLEASFIGNRFVDAGGIVSDADLGGSAPGDNLELIEEEADGKKGGAKAKPAADTE